MSCLALEPITLFKSAHWCLWSLHLDACRESLIVLHPVVNGNDVADCEITFACRSWCQCEIQCFRLAVPLMGKNEFAGVNRNNRAAARVRERNLSACEKGIGAEECQEERCGHSGQLQVANVHLSARSPHWIEYLRH